MSDSAAMLPGLVDSNVSNGSGQLVLRTWIYLPESQEAPKVPTSWATRKRVGRSDMLGD
jgi:hypothetical protein